MPHSHEYFEALRASVSQQQFDFAMEQLGMVSRFLDQDTKRQLSHLADNPARRQLMDEWFGDYVASPVKNVIALIVENGDWDILSELEKKHENVQSQEIVVTSATALSDELIHWLTNELKKMHPVALIQFAVDSALIGGVKMRIGDKEVDYSLQAKCSKFMA